MFCARYWTISYQGGEIIFGLSKRPIPSLKILHVFLLETGRQYWDIHTNSSGTSGPEYQGDKGHEEHAEERVEETQEEASDSSHAISAYEVAREVHMGKADADVRIGRIR